ncbi:MAG: hypothetical protein FWD26_07060, partial [Treponema sp.]|nr:hypothetical protein [Treponema sp.]
MLPKQGLARLTQRHRGHRGTGGRFAKTLAETLRRRGRGEEEGEEFFTTNRTNGHERKISKDSRGGAEAQRTQRGRRGKRGVGNLIVPLNS